MRTAYFCLRCGVEFIGEYHAPDFYTGHEQGGPIEPGEGPVLVGTARPAVCADCRPLLTPDQRRAWGIDAETAR